MKLSNRILNKNWMNILNKYSSEWIFFSCTVWMQTQQTKQKKQNKKILKTTTRIKCEQKQPEKKNKRQ